MRSKLLLILLVLLLSGCGLFRKSHKQVLDVRKSAEVELSSDIQGEINLSEKSERESNTHTSSEGSHTTEIEADEITVNPDGSISAKGNAKASTKGEGSTKSDKKERETKDKEVEDKYTANHTEKSVSKERIKDVDKKSEPVKGYWLWGIGGFILLCGVSWFIFKIKR